MTVALKAAVLAVVLAVGCAPPSRFEKMSRLERDIRLTATRHSPGVRISLWLSRADGREILALEPDRPIPGASTLKVLILVEAHAQAIQGTFRWTDDHTLLDTDVVGGTGSFQRERIGSSWTYLQYARRMITESDNTAANVLLRRVGLRAVNERAVKLGLQATRIEREFMDFRALDEGKDNWTTAREMGRLFRAIFRREILTPAACDEMIQLLERTSRGRIASGVPREVAVGHKSGYFPGLRHDAGWVRVPGHPYILSVFLENVGKEEGGLAALDAIGRIVYEALGPTDE